MGLDLYSRVEELFLDKEAASILWGKFIELFKNYGIKEVLDIGCGSGKFCALAKNYGIDVKGLDLSKEQVKRAKAICDCEALDVCDYKEKFHSACAVFDVVNYLPKEELERFFRCVEDRIEEYFIFDMNTLYAMEELAVGTLKSEDEERFGVLYSEFEDEMLITEITLFEKEGNCYKKHQDKIVQYYHSIKDIESATILKLQEIVPISLYGSEEAEKLILVFKK